MQQTAIGQRRECVVIGQLMNLGLRLLVLGDLRKGANVMGGVSPRRGDGGNGHPLGEDFAILSIPDFALPIALCLQGPPHLLIKDGVNGART